MNEKIVSNFERGHLYIMQNECYKNYDANFYKLGRTKNLDQRMKGYRTPFLERSEYLYTSSVFDSCVDAEYVLFCIMKKYRVHPKREFFICSLQKIIEVIKKLEETGGEELKKLCQQLKKTSFTSWYIKRYFSELEDVVELESEELDDHFSKFLFRPTDPEQYRKYGYKTEAELKIIEERLKKIE